MFWFGGFCFWLFGWLVVELGGSKKALVFGLVGCFMLFLLFV